MSLLNRLFGAKSPQFEAPLTPDASFLAIGDVHGRADKMHELLAICATKVGDAPTVFVGDYIDRGEQSAEVLRHLIGMDEAANVICLIGNHEEMLLNFLDDPQKNGPRWLRYGGLQTLASFNIAGISTGMTGSTLDKAATDLRAAMGDLMVDWLHGLPTYWQSGNVAVVHAAADPLLPVTSQSARTLRWGHPDFEDVVRSDGVWVMHGHTIVDTPQVILGRIAIDTGAYATGRLTAAHVTKGDVVFLST